MINWVAFGSLTLTCFIAMYIPYHYGSKSTNKQVYVTVFFGFLSAFCLIGMVPYDIYITKHASSSSAKNELFIMWDIVYWISFVLCWVVLPLMKLYEISGEFTWQARLKHSIKLHLREFLIIGIIGLVILIIIIAKSLISLADLPLTFALLSNTWGLFLIMVFLGYGIVAVPRYFWKNAEVKTNLDFLYVSLVHVDEEVTLASGNLDDSVKKVCASISKVPKNSGLQEQMNEVFNLCPVGLREQHAGRGSSLFAGAVTQKVLSELHAELKEHLVEYRRAKCEWNKCIRETINLEDVVKSFDSPQKRIKYTLADNSSKLGYLEWVYWTKIRESLFKFLSLFFALLSVLVLLGECTMFIHFPIGLFPLLVETDFGPYISQFIILLPLGYILFCTYFTFFTLKFPGLYGMYSKNTEPCSLVFCSLYLTRLSAPLALNFFYLVKVTGAIFWDVIVSKSAVGEIFEQLNTFFPVSLLVFSLLNYFNTYSKILSLLGINQLGIMDESAQYKIKEGRALIKRERFSLEQDSRKRKFGDWEMSNVELLRDSGYGSYKV